MFVFSKDCYKRGLEVLALLFGRQLGALISYEDNFVGYTSYLCEGRFNHIPNKTL